MKLQTLSTIGIVAAVWMFYTGSIAPLREQHADLERKSGELSRKLEATQRDLQAAGATAQQARDAREVLRQWRADRAAASANTWFPPRVREHLRRFGVGSSEARLITTTEHPAVPGVQQLSWTVSLPLNHPDEIGRTLFAAAALEQADPHARVTEVSIRRPGGEQPAGAIVKLATLAGAGE